MEVVDGRTIVIPSDRQNQRLSGFEVRLWIQYMVFGFPRAGPPSWNADCDSALQEKHIEQMAFSASCLLLLRDVCGNQKVLGLSDYLFLQAQRRNIAFVNIPPCSADQHHPHLVNLATLCEHKIGITVSGTKARKPSQSFVAVMIVVWSRVGLGGFFGCVLPRSRWENMIPGGNIWLVGVLRKVETITDASVDLEGWDEGVRGGFDEVAGNMNVWFCFQLSLLWALGGISKGLMSVSWGEDDGHVFIWIARYPATVMTSMGRSDGT